MGHGDTMCYHHDPNRNKNGIFTDIVSSQPSGTLKWEFQEEIQGRPSLFWQGSFAVYVWIRIKRVW